MADLSQMSTEQLLALAQQGQQPQQGGLASIPTEQLLAMAQNHPEAEQPGMLGQIGHQLGLTGRYALEGVGNTLGIATDPVGQFLPGYQPTGQAASSLADAIGLPKPQGKLENAVAGASKGLVSAGTTAGAGLAAGASELAAQPLMQALSAMGGGGAQEVAKDSGAGDGVQALAGLAGSLAPGAGSGAQMLARGALRGGEAGRQTMLDNINAFQAAGTTPTVGQATEGGFARGLESILAKVPGGSGVMSRKARQQGEDIGNKMTGYADELAPGSDPTSAGASIQQGIAGEGGFVDRFKQQAKQLYDAVDQHMPGDTAVQMPATQSLLSKLTTPIKGAEATSGVLANPKLEQIAKAIGTDTQNSQLAGINGALPPGSVTFGPNGVPQLGSGGTMPYQAIKSLRTKVGDMIADAGLTSDVPRGQLKQLYGSLSEDMRNATAQNPAAFQANNMAENFYRQGMDKIDKVEAIVGKAGGPEKVFGAAMSGTREGASTLSTVMSALKPEEQNVVSSAVVRRMGLANPGAQNDGGDVFSTASFLTNWNKLSPQAKGVLFSSDSGMRDNLDKIAKVTSNLREGSNVFVNPSGTASTGAQIGTATGAVMSILSGNLGGAATIGAGVGTANLGARLMTNPNFVKWLARNTQAPVGVLPAQVAYLGNLGKKDPDLAQAADLLSASLGQTGQPQ